MFSYWAPFYGWPWVKVVMVNSLFFLQSLIEEYNSSCGDLLQKFYAPELVKKDFDKFIKEKSRTLGDRLINSITLTLNMEKVGAVCRCSMLTRKLGN